MVSRQRLRSQFNERLTLIIFIILLITLDSTATDPIFIRVATARKRVGFSPSRSTLTLTKCYSVTPSGPSKSQTVTRSLSATRTLSSTRTLSAKKTSVSLSGTRTLTITQSRSYLPSRSLSHTRSLTTSRSKNSPSRTLTRSITSATRPLPNTGTLSNSSQLTGTSSLRKPATKSASPTFLIVTRSHDITDSSSVTVTVTKSTSVTSTLSGSASKSLSQMTKSLSYSPTRTLTGTKTLSLSASGTKSISKHTNTKSGSTSQTLTSTISLTEPTETKSLTSELTVSAELSQNTSTIEHTATVTIESSASKTVVATFIFNTWLSNASTAEGNLYSATKPWVQVKTNNTIPSTPDEMLSDTESDVKYPKLQRHFYSKKTLYFSISGKDLRPGEDIFYFNRIPQPVTYRRSFPAQRGKAVVDYEYFSEAYTNNNNSVEHDPSQNQTSEYCSTTYLKDFTDDGSFRGSNGKGAQYRWPPANKTVIAEPILNLTEVAEVVNFLSSNRSRLTIEDVLQCRGGVFDSADSEGIKRGGLISGVFCSRLLFRVAFFQCGQWQSCSLIPSLHPHGDDSLPPYGLFVKPNRLWVQPHPSDLRVSDVSDLAKRETLLDVLSIVTASNVSGSEANTSRREYLAAKALFPNDEKLSLWSRLKNFKTFSPFSVASGDYFQVSVPTIGDATTTRATTTTTTVPPLFPLSPTSFPYRLAWTSLIPVQLVLSLASGSSRYFATSQLGPTEWSGRSWESESTATAANISASLLLVNSTLAGVNETFDASNTTNSSNVSSRPAITVPTDMSEESFQMQMSKDAEAADIQNYLFDFTTPEVLGNAMEHSEKEMLLNEAVFQHSNDQEPFWANDVIFLIDSDFDCEEMAALFLGLSGDLSTYNASKNYSATNYAPKTSMLDEDFYLQEANEETLASSVASDNTTSNVNATSTDPPLISPERTNMPYRRYNRACRQGLAVIPLRPNATSTPSQWARWASRVALIGDFRTPYEWLKNNGEHFNATTDSNYAWKAFIQTLKNDSASNVGDDVTKLLYEDFLAEATSFKQWWWADELAVDNESGCGDYIDDATTIVTSQTVTGLATEFNSTTLDTDVNATTTTSPHVTANLTEEDGGQNNRFHDVQHTGTTQQTLLQALRSFRIQAEGLTSAIENATSEVLVNRYLNPANDVGGYIPTHKSVGSSVAGPAKKAKLCVITLNRTTVYEFPWQIVPFILPGTNYSKTLNRGQVQKVVVFVSSTALKNATLGDGSADAAWDKTSPPTSWLTNNLRLFVSEECTPESAQKQYERKAREGLLVNISPVSSNYTLNSTVLEVIFLISTNWLDGGQPYKICLLEEDQFPTKPKSPVTFPANPPLWRSYTDAEANAATSAIRYLRVDSQQLLQGRGWFELGQFYVNELTETISLTETFSRSVSLCKANFTVRTTATVDTDYRLEDQVIEIQLVGGNAFAPIAASRQNMLHELGGTGRLPTRDALQNIVIDRTLSRDPETKEAQLFPVNILISATHDSLTFDAGVPNPAALRIADVVLESPTKLVIRIKKDDDILIIGKYFVNYKIILQDFALLCMPSDPSAVYMSLFLGSPPSDVANHTLQELLRTTVGALGGWERYLEDTNSKCVNHTNYMQARFHNLFLDTISYEQWENQDGTGVTNQCGLSVEPLQITIDLPIVAAFYRDILKDRILSITLATCFSFAAGLLSGGRLNMAAPANIVPSLIHMTCLSANERTAVETQTLFLLTPFGNSFPEKNGLVAILHAAISLACFVAHFIVCLTIFSRTRNTKRGQISQASPPPQAPNKSKHRSDKKPLAVESVVLPLEPETKSLEDILANMRFPSFSAIPLGFLFPGAVFFAIRSIMTGGGSEGAVGMAMAIVSLTYFVLGLLALFQLTRKVNAAQREFTTHEHSLFKYIVFRTTGHWAPHNYERMYYSLYMSEIQGAEFFMFVPFVGIILISIMANLDKSLTNDSCLLQGAGIGLIFVIGGVLTLLKRPHRLVVENFLVVAEYASLALMSISMTAYGSDFHAMLKLAAALVSFFVLVRGFLALYLWIWQDRHTAQKVHDKVKLLKRREKRKEYRKQMVLERGLGYRMAVALAPKETDGDEYEKEVRELNRRKKIRQQGFLDQIDLDTDDELSDLDNAAVQKPPLSVIRSSAAKKKRDLLTTKDTKQKLEDFFDPYEPAGFFLAVDGGGSFNNHDDLEMSPISVDAGPLDEQSRPFLQSPPESHNRRGRGQSMKNHRFEGEYFVDMASEGYSPPRALMELDEDYDTDDAELETQELARQGKAFAVHQYPHNNSRGIKVADNDAGASSLAPAVKPLSDEAFKAMNVTLAATKRNWLATSAPENNSPNRSVVRFKPPRTEQLQQPQSEELDISDIDLDDESELGEKKHVIGRLEDALVLDDDVDFKRGKIKPALSGRDTQPAPMQRELEDIEDEIDIDPLTGDIVVLAPEIANEAKRVRKRNSPIANVKRRPPANSLDGPKAPVMPLPPVANADDEDIYTNDSGLLEIASLIKAEEALLQERKAKAANQVWKKRSVAQIEGQRKTEVPSVLANKREKKARLVKGIFEGGQDVRVAVKKAEEEVKRKALLSQNPGYDVEESEEETEEIPSAPVPVYDRNPLPVAPANATTVGSVGYRFPMYPPLETRNAHHNALVNDGVEAVRQTGESIHRLSKRPTM